MVNGGLAGLGGSWDALTNATMQQAALSALAVPAVQVNRARAAAAVDAGYDVMATYMAWRPVIFAVSTMGAVVSGAALTRRIRTPEAVALYGIMGALSALVAWYTRPDMLRKPPAQAIPTDPNAPQGMAGAVGWLDQRVAHNSAERPGWEAATYTRLASDLGMGTLNPAVQALLTQNSH
jgi:hypothetical protein